MLKAHIHSGDTGTKPLTARQLLWSVEGVQSGLYAHTENGKRTGDIAIVSSNGPVLEDEVGGRDASPRPVLVVNILGESAPWALWDPCDPGRWEFLPHGDSLTLTNVHDLI